MDLQERFLQETMKPGQEQLEKQLAMRKAVMEKHDRLGKPYGEITEIAFQRIILHIKGKLHHLDPNKPYGIRFVTPTRTLMYYPDHFDLQEDGTFFLSLNIMCTHEEQPLRNGRFNMTLFVCYPGHRGELQPIENPNETRLCYGNDLYHVTYDDKGYVQNKTLLTQEYPCYLSTTLLHTCDDTAANPWNFKVNKTKSSWLRVISHEDMDNAQFYFSVNYKPYANFGVLYLHRKQARAKRKNAFITFKRNLGKDLADTKLFIFKKLNRLFQKFAKRQGNIILFCSASRAEIGGNEKFIYDRMIERGLDKRFQFRFDFKASITTNRSIWQMIKFDYYLATSDVIVLDDYYPIIYDVDYAPEVKVVQVWHACGAFKTVGFERIGKKDAPHFNSTTHKCYTHVIVSSELSARHNAEAFCISESKFYITGIPRTDLFFDPQYKLETTKQMYEAFPGCQNKKKVYLYAPTFRGTNANNATFPFEKIDLEQWGKQLVEEDAALIVKMHPFVTKHIDILKAYADRIFDATQYREINDILFIADVLITDYSSVIYEMSLLHKPMVFYAFDQHSYENSRDFYEPYEDTVPGKIVHDFDDLLECLRNEDYEFEKMEHFVQKNFAHLDGKSTDRVIDQVFLDIPAEETHKEERNPMNLYQEEAALSGMSLCKRNDNNMNDIYIIDLYNLDINGAPASQLSAYILQCLLHWAQYTRNNGGKVA